MKVEFERSSGVGLVDEVIAGLGGRIDVLVLVHVGLVVVHVRVEEAPFDDDMRDVNAFGAVLVRARESPSRVLPALEREIVGLGCGSEEERRLAIDAQVVGRFTEAKQSTVGVYSRGRLSGAVRSRRSSSETHRREQGARDGPSDYGCQRWA
ncbi:hypothetical protein [Halomontanus rarus]|uniref:hypothetical protein n=1 Tax=Halomontanus rarus TaxID=3034020 RepID=UPI001A99F3F2